MTINKDIRCENPTCIASIEKYGEQYHSVYDLYSTPPPFMPEAIAICEHCGGYTDGKKWVYICKKCGKSVNPGELVGLFVPHLCQECLDDIVESDRKNGNICTLCHKPRSLCCC